MISRNGSESASEPGIARLDGNVLRRGPGRSSPALWLLLGSLLLSSFSLPLGGLGAPSHPAGWVPMPNDHVAAPALPTPGLRSASGPSSSSVPAALGLAGFGWVDVTPTNGPKHLNGAVAAYDPADGYLVLGGARNDVFPNGTWLLETWTYANGTWTNITATAGVAPPFEASSHSSLVYDAADHYLMMVNSYGDSTVGFRQGAWFALPAPPTNAGLTNLVYDSSAGYVVATPSGSYCYAASQGGSPVTYAYSNGTWTRLNATNTPCLYYAMESDDPPTGGIVALGGYHYSRQGADTIARLLWTYANGSWTNQSLDPSSGLPFVASYTGTLTEIPTASALVLVDSVYVGVPSRYTTVVWEYNGTWTNLTTPFTPPASAGPEVASWDAAAGGLVLWGAGPSSPSTNEIWTYGPNATLRVAVPVSTPSVSDAGAPVAFAPVLQGGTYPLNFTWGFGDGASSYLSHPTHRYQTAGTYNVTLTIRDALAKTGRNQSSVEIVAPLAGRISASPPIGDAGVPVHFALPISGGTSPVGYAWRFGDGSGSNGTAPSHNYSKRGNYSITAWVNDSGGGSLKVGWNEPVNAPLNVSFSASPSKPDLGQLVNFSATVTGGTAPYVYHWTFGDGGTGGDLANISHVFTTNGPFSAAISVTDAAGGIAGAERNFTVLLNLSIVGSWALGAAPLPVGFTSRVSGGVPSYSYLWRFGDGGTSDLADPSHTFSSPGTYTTSLTVSDADGNSAQAVWPVQVFEGSGPLTVRLLSDVAPLPVGSTTLVTATVSGGVGGYQLSWDTNGTARCGPSGPLSERCTVVAAGSGSATLQVTDSSGSSAMGTVLLSLPSVQPSPPHPQASSPWPAATYGLIAIGVGALALGALLWGRAVRSAPGALWRKGDPSAPREDEGAIEGSPGSDVPPRPAGDRAAVDGGPGETDDALSDLV
ncbi:MAG TPA: PKD domain-containing protein [Thermoplasmata archaeon]|nr:PKD domain-containing protein [Thermoplasmata archaeon]